MTLVIVALLGTAVITRPERPANTLLMLQQAAAAGDAGAQLQLGLAYREGRYGLVRDEASARHWIERAAASGNRYASRLEGRESAPTTDTDTRFLRDFSAIFRHSGAIARLKADAEAGDTTAQYQLAMRYHDGAWGVARDEAEALRWLLRAAQGGNKVARATLARAYESGAFGLTPDAARARYWRMQAD